MMHRSSGLVAMAIAAFIIDSTLGVPLAGQLHKSPVRSKQKRQAEGEEPAPTIIQTETFTLVFTETPTPPTEPPAPPVTEVFTKVEVEEHTAAPVETKPPEVLVETTIMAVETAAYETTEAPILMTQPAETTIKVEASPAPEKPAIVPGTVDKSVFDCSNLAVGMYGNPKEKCDTKFYFCVDPTALAYEQPCPHPLYFDDETKICDSWSHIPACSGKPRPTPEPTLAPASVVPPAPSVVNCANKTSGRYPDPVGTIKPMCSNRFYFCITGLEYAFNCPHDLVYNPDTDRCEDQSLVFVCTGSHIVETTVIPTPRPTWAHVDFDCSSRKNGYYADKCSNVFYACNAGRAQELHCPKGLVYDMDMQVCDIPSNTFTCTGTKKPILTTVKTEAPIIVPTTPSPLDCYLKMEGLYPDPVEKCSREFYYCAHNTSFRMPCPGNLYYDNENKRCDLWLNVFDCSGNRPTQAPVIVPTPPPTFAPVKFDCSRLDNGQYPNPDEKCSQFYYQCSNMLAFKQDCPDGLYYDADRKLCDSWIHVFACSGQALPPTTPAPTFAPIPPRVPLYNCSKKASGLYPDPANTCSSIFYQCSNGYDTKMECPAGLFFDDVLKQCEQRDYVFACSGQTRPPPPPPAPTLVPSPAEVLPKDCTQLADGNYADPEKKCSHIFYTCSGGYAVRQSCSGGTYFDEERNTCDRYEVVFACSGKRPEPTTAAPIITHPPRPTYPFDCTKRYDGLYPAADCVKEYWACVGGVTFAYSCGEGTVYDEEFQRCEFSYNVPKCGGQRPTPPPTAGPLPTKGPVLFDCSRQRDGNYPDPEAKDGCSHYFYSCHSGISDRFTCPEHLVYDVSKDACYERELVAACTGQSPIMPESTLPGNAITTLLPIGTETKPAGAMTSAAPLVTETISPIHGAETTLAPSIIESSAASLAPGTELPVTSMAPVVETAAPTLAPSATSMAPAVETAAPTLAPAVETAAPTLAPAVETAAPTVAPAVETAAPTLAPAVETAAPTAAPAIETAAPTLAPAVETAAPTGLPVEPAAATTLLVPPTPTVA